MTVVDPLFPPFLMDLADHLFAVLLFHVDGVLRRLDVMFSAELPFFDSLSIKPYHSY